MTELLYLNDCYIREFDATVAESGEGFVVLGKTAFYPEGGGQESDIGIIEFPGGKAEVLDVQKKDGKVIHRISCSIPAGSKVHGIVDWDRRYKEMRMHTSQHMLAAIVARLYQATCAGNQIHTDKTRIDFAPVDFKESDLRVLEDESRKLIEKGAPVSIEYVSREAAERDTFPHRVNWGKYPPDLKNLRMIRIEGIDYDPCGGTHVRNIKEIVGIKIVNKENKGSQRQRISYVLE